jgi:hypothetical protein
VLNYMVNDIHSTPALASPGLFIGQTLVRLPLSAAATARTG